MSKLTDWLAEPDAPEPADNQSSEMADWWDGWTAARKKVRELLMIDIVETDKHMSTSIKMGTSPLPFTYFTSTQYDEI